jgi:hypothetical protein
MTQMVSNHKNTNNIRIFINFKGENAALISTEVYEVVKAHHE